MAKAVSTKVIPTNMRKGYKSAVWDERRSLLDIVSNHLPSDSGGELQVRVKVKGRWKPYERLTPEDQVAAVEIQDGGRGTDYRLLTELGGSSKTWEWGSIGQWGEGAKLAALALVSKGMTVSVESRDWVLDAYINGSDLLEFGLKTGKKERTGTRTIIHNPNNTLIEQVRRLPLEFLRLQKDVKVMEGVEMWIPGTVEDGLAQLKIKVQELVKAPDYLKEVHHTGVEQMIAVLRQRNDSLSYCEPLTTLEGNLSDITPETFASLTLWMPKPGHHRIIEPKGEGSVYVKGVRIEDRSDLLFSYDLDCGSVNSDRSQLTLDAGRTIRYVLSQAKESAIIKTILEKGEKAQETATSGNIALEKRVEFDLEETVHQSEWAAEFKSRFGERAVLASYTSYDKEAGGKGYRVVRVPPSIGKLLEKAGVLTATRLVAAGTHGKEIPLSELTGLERQIYGVYERVNDVLNTRCKPPIILAEFLNEKGEKDNTLGEYVRREDQIYLVRDLLVKEGYFVATFIHELGHKESGAADYTREHTRWIQEAAATVFGQLKFAEATHSEAVQAFEKRTARYGEERERDVRYFMGVITNQRTETTRRNEEIQREKACASALARELERERSRSLRSRIAERLGITKTVERMQNMAESARERVREATQLPESVRAYLNEGLVADLLVLDANLRGYQKFDDKPRVE